MELELDYAAEVHRTIAAEAAEKLQSLDALDWRQWVAELDPNDAEAAMKWLHERYHAPSDDLNQPVDLEAAGKFETMVADIALRVADAPKPPAWNSDSFFERFAAGK